MEKKKKIIITISREHGSGGREIGTKLAERLGISFYDKALIDLVAEESGLPATYVKANEQKISNRFLFNMSVNNYYSYWNENYQYTPLPDNLFQAQYKVIQSIAEKESCVIVGRCADYILSKRKDCLHIFVYADQESKVERIALRFDGDKKKAASDLKRVDKGRSNHYNHFTEKEWGKPESYDICINSSSLGIEMAVDIIMGAVEAKSRQTNVSK